MSSGQVVKIRQKTGFVKHRTTIKWTLENCELLFNTSADEVYESEGYTLENTDIVCSLKLNINDQKEPLTVGSYSYYLYFSTLEVHVVSTNEMEHLKVNVTIAGPEGKCHRLPMKPPITYDTSGVLEYLLPSKDTYTDTLPQHYLINESLRSYLVNDTLTFLCELEDVRAISNTCKSTATTSDWQIQVPMNKFGRLFENRQLCDVTFVIGSVKIPAHTVVLSAVSSYFLAMFGASGMKEKLERIVDLSNDSDVDVEVFQGFLNCIYGLKRVDEMKDMALDLIVLAHKYDVKELQSSCESFLCDSMGKASAAACLLIANKYNFELLKERALWFAKIYVDSVKASDEFSEICKDVDLMRLLL